MSIAEKPKIQKPSNYEEIPGSLVGIPHLEQTIIIDEYYFPEHSRVDLKTCVSWLKANPSIYTMFKSKQNNRVCGYINALPVTTGAFNRFLTGSSMDIHLDYNDVVYPLAPGDYKLYIASIAVHPDHRSGWAYKYLSDSFVKKLIAQAEAGIFYTEVLMDVFTPEGAKLAAHFGASPILSTVHETTLYALKIDSESFPENYGLYRQLKDLYRHRMKRPIS